jgi:hypothetical protein
MTMLIDRFNELLPWYVNGTLDATDRAWMDKYLQDHPQACQQLRWEQLLREEVQRNSPNVSEEIGLAKVMARIHLADPMPTVFGKDDEKTAVPPPTDIDTGWQKLSAPLKQLGLPSPGGKTMRPEPNPSVPYTPLTKSEFQREAIRLEPEYRHLVVNVAKFIVAKLSPHELPLFPYISETFVKTPKVAFSFSKGEQALAFGAGTGELAITTPVLAVTAELVAYLRNELKALPGEATIAALNAVFKATSMQQHQENYRLSSIQLAQITELTESASRRAGLSSSFIAGLLELIRDMLTSE